MKNCSVCSFERNLTLHHIHPREFRFCYPFGSELIDQDSNLLLVCSACHTAIHDPRPWSMMIREVREKLAKEPKRRSYADNKAEQQAARDLMIQRLTWERSLALFQNVEVTSKLDVYRNIIQKLIKQYKGKKRG